MGLVFGSLLCKNKTNHKNNNRFRFILFIYFYFPNYYVSFFFGVLS